MLGERSLNPPGAADGARRCRARPDRMCRSAGGRPGLRCPAHQHAPLPEEIGNMVPVSGPPGPEGGENIPAFFVCAVVLLLTIDCELLTILES